jgi:hypothetical protein
VYIFKNFAGYLDAATFSWFPYHLSFTHGLLVKYLLRYEETESGRRQEVMKCGAGRTFNKGLSM